jgi:hypothetical protein
VDDDGRYIQSADGWSSNKTYKGMENRRIVNSTYDKYWIIDNSGNVDFKLNFEIFDFSGSVTKLPANLVAPYDGDMLSVYDASNADAVDEYLDIYGNKKFTLKDSSKLKHLFTLKGSYQDSQNNPFVMIDSEVLGDLEVSGRGFITPSITQCSRICLIPFTDYGDDGNSVASGFKLKAGPKHYVEYNNYDSIDSNGEYWVHISPETSNGIWSSCSKLKMNYEYFASTAITDYEKGSVIFDNRLKYPLIGTFVHYLYLEYNKAKNESVCYKPVSYFNSDKVVTNFVAS